MPARSFVPGEVPQGTLRLVNNSPSHISQAFFKLLLLGCISKGHLWFSLSKGGDSAPYARWALSELSGLIFKVLGFKFCWLKELTKFGTLTFNAKCYGDSSSPCRLPSVIVCFSPPPPLCSLPFPARPTASLPFLTYWMWPLLYI